MLDDTSLNKEYLPQRGDVEYSKLCQKLIFGGDSKLIKEGLIATVQTLSGTGALRLGAEFLKRYAPGATIYVSDPTWGTHNSIMDQAGVPLKKYRYWDAENKNLDLAGMLADIVKLVLSTPALEQEWRDELLAMSVRIQDMRKELEDELVRLGTPGSWSHITSQIGMFSFTGLSPAQSKSMVDKHHVYMLGNGRISMAGVTTKNVKYMAASIDDVARNVE